MIKSGVYKLKNGARVEEILIAAGGLSAKADRDWVNKNLNRAEKVYDGQKIFIPKVRENIVVNNTPDAGCCYSKAKFGEFGRVG